jgi:hypothetical protein
MKKNHNYMLQGIINFYINICPYLQISSEIQDIPNSYIHLIHIQQHLGGEGNVNFTVCTFKQG